jgi:hypothetical protein
MILYPLKIENSGLELHFRRRHFFFDVDEAIRVIRAAFVGIANACVCLVNLAQVVGPVATIPFVVVAVGNHQPESSGFTVIPLCLERKWTLHRKPLLYCYLGMKKGIFGYADFLFAPVCPLHHT